MSESKIPLALALLENHPKAAAAILEQHAVEHVAQFLGQIPPALATRVAGHMLPPTFARLSPALGATQMADLISPLAASQIVAILRPLEASQQAEVLERLPRNVRLNCKLLLRYTTDLVGAWVSPHVVSVPDDIAVSEVQTYLQAPARINYTRHVFVLDRDRDLKGRIAWSDLRNAPPELPVSALMDPLCPSVKARSLIYSLIRHPFWTQEEAFAVVNNSGQFVGVLRHLDLRRYLDRPVEGMPREEEEAPVTGLIQLYGLGLRTLLQALHDSLESDLKA